MVVKIYGLPQSTNTQRVLVVLEELGVAYELIPVSFTTGEHRTEEYAKDKHPFGQFPALEDEDGFKLFESRAISRYLAEKYGDGKLLPRELKARALFEQAASIETANFEPYASGLYVEKIMKPMFGSPTDEKRAEEYEKTLGAKLKGYEIILSRQKYLAGNELTLADLFHLPHGRLLSEKLGVQALTSDSLPNVKRWWADIASRDSWKAVQAKVISLT